MKLITITILFISFVSIQNRNIESKLNNDFNNQINNDSIIHWSSHYKLKWLDFKGNVPANIGIKKAETCSEIIMQGEFFEGELPDFKVTNNFLINKSWTITSDVGILKHEQGHFDIAEIFSRKIRKRIVELRKKKEFDVQVYLNEYKRLRNECSQYHEKYDRQVYFNEVRQKQWYVMIAKQLKGLQEYSINYVQD